MISKWLHQCRTTEGEDIDTVLLASKVVSHAPTKETGGDKEWSWEVPGLSKGSPWYRERLRSLRRAIQSANLTDMSHWYQEGKEAHSICNSTGGNFPLSIGNHYEKGVV
jgi:hypothetical protein